MTRYLIVIIALFPSLFIAKSELKTTPENNTTFIQKSTVRLSDDEALNEYHKFLNQLDTIHIENSTLAATKFREVFKSKERIICDSAFFLFDNYYARLSNNLNELHNKNTGIRYADLVSNKTPQHPLSAKLAAYSKKLKENGFKVYMAEGDTYIGRDLDFVTKWFYDYVSPATKEYLAQLNSEDKAHMMADGGIIIEAHKFVDRTIWWEKFIAKYPNAFVKGKAQSIFKNALNTLLRGTENSPVIDYQNNKLSAYYKTAYTYLETTFASTQTNKLVNPYYKHLLRKENAKAESMLNDYQQKGIIY